MSGFETIVLTNLFLSGSNPPPNVLTCPAGKTAISGGVDLTNAISGLGHVVRASYPSASNQWTVAASAPDGAGSSQTLATAYVQCAFVQ